MPSRTMMIVLAAFVAVAAAQAFGQSGLPIATPGFEVVSLKRATLPPDASPGVLTAGCGLPLLQRRGERVAIPVATLCGLIRLAYGVADYQVVDIPQEWTRPEAANLFTVDARAADGGATPEQLRSMLQAMLADRFHLRVHRARRELPIYALVVKDRPKAASCADPTAPSLYTPGHLVSCTPPMPMARIAQLLTREAGRPVVDRTGLTEYAFELRWLPESAPPQADSPPNLFTAVQEQLGLKLEPQRDLVDVIVVDHAQPPAAN